MIAESIFAGIIAVAFIIIIVLLCGQTYGRNSELAQLCDETKHGEDVEKIAELYKKAQMLYYDLPKAEAMIQKIGTAEDDRKLEEKYCRCCSHVVEVPTCRYPEILCLKKTMVRLKKFSEPVHMNKLQDYYKNDIYVCQAPTTAEFERYFNAIMQEQIGVVLWLTKPNETLDSYIPMKKGLKKYGEYIVEFETSGKRDEYDFYFIRVLPSVQMELAYLVRVIFIVGHSWILKGLPKHMTRQSDLISLVQCFHDFTVENGFPGLLVHNTAGVNQTLGFVTAYIGRQMLLDKRKVNIVGIAKHIRKARHCAFTQEKNTAEHLQTVYMILGSFSRNFAYEEMGQMNTTKEEKDLFERAKKAHPLPREAISAWGEKFSYVKKNTVMHGKITSYKPSTAQPTEKEKGEEGSKKSVKRSRKDRSVAKESVAQSSVAKESVAQSSVPKESVANKSTKTSAKDPYLAMSKAKKKKK